MLTISNCEIRFGKSSYYARLAVIIYVSSIVLLVNSAFIFVVKIIVVALLLVLLIRIVINPVPNPNYLKLSYNHEGWLLHDKNCLQISYDKIRVVINTGLFFLLELSGEARPKLLVIFSDQINDNSYRILNIIEKIKK